MLKRKHRGDYLLVAGIGVLALLGLIIIYSISPVLSYKLVGNVDRNYFLYNQLKHLGLGLAAFIITSRFNWHKWPKVLPVLLVLSGLSLLLMMIPQFAITHNGATRWVGIGGFSFQPAELLKLTVVILVASRLSQLNDTQIKDNRMVLWPTIALLGILSLFVLILQKDMGTMLVVAAIVVGLFYLAGTTKQQLVTLLSLGGVFGVANIILFPHRVERVLTFFNPSHNTNDSGYHLNQSLIAFGSGGLLGLGLGKSVQVYGYLPEAANDSIFAIIGETFGFIGAVTILALFSFIIWRCLKIAQGAPDRLSYFLVSGITLWVGAQAAINMAAMIGIIPLTGIALPFLSYGGTSLITIMAAMGIVVNISKYSTKGKTYENSFERRRHRRTHHAFARRST